jgi:cytochrome b561
MNPKTRHRAPSLLWLAAAAWFLFLLVFFILVSLVGSALKSLP